MKAAQLTPDALLLPADSDEAEARSDTATRRGRDFSE